MTSEKDREMAMQAGSWFDRKDLTLAGREARVAALFATVRAEEQTNFVNNIAAVLDDDDVEAFTALIMKALKSPNLNNQTRSALKSEAEIRKEEKEAALSIVRACSTRDELHPDISITVSEFKERVMRLLEAGNRKG